MLPRHTNRTETSCFAVISRIHVERARILGGTTERWLLPPGQGVAHRSLHRVLDRPRESSLYELVSGEECHLQWNRR